MKVKLNKRIGEEGSGGRVIGFTDCMNIMPGHGHRQMDCPIRKMISYNVKESGKPAVLVLTCQ